MRVEEVLRLAKAYLTEGKFREAIATCQQILEHKPDLAEAYKILGEALEAEGALTVARQAYLKAVALQPDFAEVHACLGQLYSQDAYLDEAAFHYQQALALCPQWPELYYNLGNVYYRHGNLPAAIRSYRQAIALKPDYVSAYYNLGFALDCQGQESAAIDCYRQAIALQPDSVEAYSNLGCMLVKQGKPEAAVEIYQQAIAIDPNSASLYNNLGQLLLAQKPDEAIAAYHRALELQPDLVLAHYNLGKAWQKYGKHEAAVACFQKLIALNPHYLSGYSECGSSLMAIGKVAEAMFYFHQAIAFQPAFVEAYCHYASLLLEQDELERATAACGRFLKALMGRKNTAENSLPLAEICQHLAQTYLHLGNALVEYGGYIQAEIYYQKALQIQPNTPEVYRLLGNCLAKQRRYDAAIMIYHIALGIQSAGRDSKTGNFGTAVPPEICASLPLADVRASSRAELYFELGKALEKQQKWEQAIPYYQQVLHWQQQGNRGNFSAETSCPLPLPKGVYLSTWDWVVANHLERQFHYTRITWQTENPVEIIHHPLPESECGGLTCGPCLNRITKWFAPVHLGWGIHICSQTGAIPVETPPTFVATIPQGRAWIVPQKTSWLVCSAIAVMTPDNYLLADISRDYPGFLPGCQKHDPAKHSVFQLESFPPLEQVDGRVAVLSALSGSVYFHWIVDLLPRIELLRRRGIDFNTIDYFLVNSYQYQFQRETLQTLGIPEHKILESDRHPHLQAKELICPSFPGYLGWPPPWAIEFLRQEFLTQTQGNSRYPERIYISRNKARYRRVLNEEEVIEMLNQHGFVSILPETLSFQEQVAIFHHAKVIIAPHGSGLTNIIFCRPGTKIVELVSPHYVGHYYWAIGHYLKLQHYFVAGEAFECYPIRQLMYQNPLTEDIWLNLSSLKKMLEIAGVKD